MSRRFSCGAAVFGCMAMLAVTAFTAAEIPGLQGRANLSASDLDFELREADFAGSGRDVWIVAASRPRGNPTAAESLVLATFDRSRELTRNALRLPGEPASSDQPRAAARRRSLEDMAVAGDGRVALAMARGVSPTPILFLQPGGRPVEGARGVTLAGSDLDVQELVQRADGSLLALGLAGGRPFIAEVAADGKTVWQEAIAADPALIDLARATSDGGVVLLGRRGVSADAQEVWVAKLSAKGRLERAVTLAARGGAVAALAGGGYGVVTHGAGARGFDVTLRAFTDDMRERWSKTLVTDQVNPVFDIAATPSGGFVVAGTKDRGLWVTNYDAEGGVVWTDHRVPAPPEMEMVFNLKLIAQGETFALPYTAFTIEGREQRQSVRVLTFLAK